jgi:nitronate monooxygenase
MTFRSLLSTDLPIIQAPMAGVQNSALAVSVCEAGGLGSLPCAMLSIEAMQEELEKIRGQTSRPYNLNFFCHSEPAPEPERERAWRETLKPYYEELGVDAGRVPPPAARAPFNAEAAELLERIRPPVVSFHFGLPPPRLLARVKTWRPLILSSATTVEEALWLEEQGVDAIIAQGLEAGGHRGMFLTVTTQIGTLALVPQIVRAVRCPVIAAGGIVDARSVQAALALGAAAVQVGTAYLLAPEATTGAVHRAALKSTAAQHTALTNVFTGRPARGIVNRAMRELGPLNHLVPAFPRAAAAMQSLRAEAEKRGSGDFSPLWSGQNAGACREMPAAEITRELAALL